ncbi:MAG: carbon starvation protein A [Hydrogenobacter thermophilus]|uniref:carbon starvation CstA family protein n=1 Tax=Hydrogenobacter thermophilus TaxID=940 RepID=UPI001C77C2D9|nr:carbon starvation CstA family protein [Hydrogenobacter thermophilus]QWK19314.1 MAG: carbon starvation protein A [Hydrogenobacter thermophilus]
MKPKDYLILGTVSLLGAFAFAVLALSRGERVGAVWILIAALCIYFIGYRFYSYFIAYRVFEVNDQNPTPAHRFYNKLDYVPTNRWVLFGHHFASISGAGPLVGPVLAAQMGYLPGTLWILIGAVLAGCVQDMVVLIISMRKGGRSLGQIAKEELGSLGGLLSLTVIYTILIILLAVLALVVVKALAQSPWGTFSVFMTIPIAMLMGIYMWHIRPGAVLHASLFGFLALMLSLYMGRWIATNPHTAKAFTLSEPQLAIALMIYGFMASVLPVWLLLAPRDYLSTFLKLGTVLLIALGVFFVNPEIKMPAITQFAISGNGPVLKGDLFPFLFITIACGAVSGFHSLISSGTSPKLIDKESHVRLVGYGGMIGESFVAIMAMIAAVSMEPGIYFAINSPASEIGKTVLEASQKISSWGFYITPQELERLAHMVEEKTILSRTGGAPAFAIGMALIFAKITGESLLAFWYHFAILFEAVFILTTIDAGTRVGRYILQDLLGNFLSSFRNYADLKVNLITSFITVASWGYFLYAGVVDPYGGIKTLWPLFGIANQLLATLALTVATVYIINMGKGKYAWVPGVPAMLMSVNTISAGILKVVHPDKDIGFLAHVHWLSEKVSQGTLPPAIPSVDVAHKVILGDYINAVLATIYVAFVSLVILNALYVIIKKLKLREATA